MANISDELGKLVDAVDGEDAVLLKTAATAPPVQKVGSASERSGVAVQSHDARAWTMGGNVD